MKTGSSAVLMAVVLAACGGNAEESTYDADQSASRADSSVSPPPSHPAPVPPAGTVDTAGVGVSPPTAGGQLVDTAAVPGPVDTAKGTPTAP